MTDRETRPGAGVGALRKRRIGELLVDEGLISPGQLREALDMQAKNGGKVVENLIHLGHIDSDAFVAFLARQPGTPSIGLTNYVVSQDLVNLVPKAFALKHEVFPIDKLGKLLTVGMACPLDSAAIAELEQLTGLRIKALLCSANDIRNAVRRYYPDDETPTEEEAAAAIGSTLRLESVANMVRALDALPGLPETVERVRAAMDEPDISMAEVADVIARDPAISAGLLRLANSAAFGFSNRVDNVHMAVKLLGLREIYMAVMSSAVIDLFKNGPCFDYQKFWRRSIACGVAAKTLAERCGEKRGSTAFTAGLLARIGQLALAQAAPERYAEVDQELTGFDLLACEEKVLGLTHTEAAYELGSMWRLPEDLLEAVRFYHAPTRGAANPALAATVSVATVLADALASGGVEDSLLFARCTDALELLGLTEADALAVFKDLPRLIAQNGGL